MSYKILAAALRAAAAVLDTDESAAPAAAEPAKAPRARKVATESAPPAAAPAAATPAPVAQPPATAPAEPTAPAPSITAVNNAISKLAGTSADGRKAAVGILAKRSVEKTPQLKVEQYQAVIDECEEEQAKLDAASANKSLV